MDKNKIVTIIVIIAIAIVAILGISYIGKLNANKTTVEIYTGRTGKEFENKFVKDYKEMKKLIKEASLGNLTKNYQTYDVSEIFNEEYFETKKLQQSVFTKIIQQYMNII